MFAYAGYAHWSFDFHPGEHPPSGGPARPRWAWMPEAVPISRICPYFDYVLSRGFGFGPPAGTYTLKWHDRHRAV